jgi:hypothetical protein
MSVFASGRYSQAVCDRCGFAYAYLTMRKEPNGSWVCPTCWDVPFDIKNHPQNHPPPISPDGQALEHARPDVVLATAGDAGWSVSLTLGGYL